MIESVSLRGSQTNRKGHISVLLAVMHGDSLFSVFIMLASISGLRWLLWMLL